MPFYLFISIQFCCLFICFVFYFLWLLIEIAGRAAQFTNDNPLKIAICCNKYCDSQFERNFEMYLLLGYQDMKGKKHELY